MPIPSAKINLTEDFPSYKNVNLLADVAITPINTFVDVLTFGTMPAGTYIIDGQIVVAQITAAAVVTYKVLDVAAIVAAGEATIAVGAGLITIGGFIINHLASGILKIQLASTALTTTAKAIALNNGTGTTGFVSFATIARIG